MVFLEVPTSVWLPLISMADTLWPLTREPEVTLAVFFVSALVSYSLVADSAVMVMGRGETVILPVWVLRLKFAVTSVLSWMKVTRPMEASPSPASVRSPL